jgi:pyruvate/2-oxoglutarate dehydrogenase complex dihydrolipoamide acyltransferase (E2) component
MNLNIKKTMGIFSLLLALIQSPCLGFLEDDEETIIRSPLPGVIRHIAVMPGQQVKRGDFLFEIEAMKMLMSIRAPRPGFIGPLLLDVDQLIEKDMSLVAILPFMPEGENIDPMDKDKSPLPIVQDKESFVKDIPQKEDLREVAESLTSPVNAGETSDISSPEGVIEDEHSTLEIENKPQTLRQQVTSPWVATNFIRPLEKESISNVSFPSVIKTQTKPFTPEPDIAPQPSHQKVMSHWIATDSPHHVIARVRPLNDEAEVSAMLQKAKAEELGQGKNNAQTSAPLSLLIGFFLLGALSFRRSKPITPYCVKNILSPEAAVNWNIPRYLREAA